MKFTVSSKHPCPFNVCYCSICRKTAGSTGAATNISAITNTLNVVGEKHIRVYRAIVRNPGEDNRTSVAERRFCSECGTPLWVWDPRWPEMMHPFASAIDTPLPKPPVRTHLMTEFKPDWVDYRPADGDSEHERYPEQSIAEWHEAHGLVTE